MTLLRSHRARLFGVTAGLVLSACARPSHELVLAGGRVIDPESGLDGVRWVAVDGGEISAISVTPLDGREVVDVEGMVVAPGFIDLHAPASGAGQGALGGVTTALELGPGVYPVDGWYREMEGDAVINFGASVSHPGARLAVLGGGDDGRQRAVTGTEMEALVGRIREGLSEGGLGLGFAIDCTPGATPAEIEDLFGVAGFDHAPVFVRPRGPGFGPLEEVLVAASRTGAPLHFTSLGGGVGYARALAWIDSAGVDGPAVSAQIDPYAGTPATPEPSAGPACGEGAPEEAAIAAALSLPGVTVTSGGSSRAGGPGGAGGPHPSGAFARVLGHYVRERGTLTLIDALARMTNLPARRLEAVAPAFRKKGRVRVGADADLTVFDAATVMDRRPAAESERSLVGIRHVLVGGVFVVRDGALVRGVRPGRGIRAVPWM